MGEKKNVIGKEGVRGMEGWYWKSNVSERGVREKEGNRKREIRVR